MGECNSLEYSLTAEDLSFSREYEDDSSFNISSEVRLNKYYKKMCSLVKVLQG